MTSEDAQETNVLFVVISWSWLELTQNGGEESDKDQQGNDPDQGDLRLLELW